MNKTRLEWRVGLFVLIGLLLMAALLIQFSKGASLFRSSYTILLRSGDVAGLKANADVLMAGVRIGSVGNVELAADGKTVIIPLHILSRYQIKKDARFVISQSGFLGDQYVGIIPTENKGDVFRNGEQAQSEPPFNLQEAARTAAGFVERINEMAKQMSETMVDLRKFVLNRETLTNVAISVENMRNASDRAVALLDNINRVVSSNQPPLMVSSSNLLVFSRQLNTFADQLNRLVNTNTDSINATVKNLESSSETLKTVMADVQAGKGTVGTLLRNDQLAANMEQIASNLNITSSNLNRLGLWGILWKKKEPRPEPAAQPLASPKNSY